MEVWLQIATSNASSKRGIVVIAKEGKTVLGAMRHTCLTSGTSGEERSKIESDHCLLIDRGKGQTRN